MDAQKLQLKLYLTSESAKALSLESFIPVFHRWIRESALPELLVDVANYAHVPEGPGVVLIGHGSDYFLDLGEGRPGLLHNRKRAGFAPAERLADLARRTLHAATLVEADPSLGGRVRFATGELLFRINDRLAAPAGDPATFAAVEAELGAFARRLYPEGATLARASGPKELFAVRIRSQAAPSIATLLERAGGPPGPDASVR
jgi:hypothetical protein